jgi:dihydrofolate synthase/folylpolyglutamate synthase
VTKNDVSAGQDTPGGEAILSPCHPVTLSPCQDYEQALAFLYDRVNYERTVPKPGDFRLDRMRALLRLLGDPHRCLRIIHVAGSKGKGSTAAMLAAILRRAGYRTGLFTSPHLTRLEERIQVDGRPLGRGDLAALVGDLRPVVERLERPGAGRPPGLPAGLPCSGLPAFSAQCSPTFFELVTALGFLYFWRRRVEAAVVEVGLGGRFDSTNVCRPAVSVITSISLDHTQQLGDRLASIAMEKAGIVKPGVPAVSGATALEARQVIEDVCRRRQAPLLSLGVDFHYRYRPGTVTDAGLARPRVGLTSRVGKVLRNRVTGGSAWPEMELSLLGEHQAANAAVAVACVEVLRDQGWHIPDAAVARGLATTDWPARLEVVRPRGGGPLVVLDCAHNVASARALVQTLHASFPEHFGARTADHAARNGTRARVADRRLLLFAASGDKDVPGILRELAPSFTHAFFCRYGNNPRSVPPGQLIDMLRRCSDLPATACGSAAAALQAARALAGPDDLICVTGSVFLAGELRPLLVADDLPEGAEVTLTSLPGR